MRKLIQPFILILLAGLVSACDTGYREKDGSYVYVDSNEMQGRVEHPIKDADAKTFRILDPNGYAKDKLRVYYLWRTLEGADPNTFVTLSALYGKDAVRVYYMDKAIPNASPASFSLIDIQWARDKNDVYFQNRPISACDPATFAFLTKDWQRDSQCVYRTGRKLQNADPSSFVVLNFWFGKDKNYVYDSFPRIIEGADAATFKIRDGSCEVCAEDKNRCYRYEKVVECTTTK